MRTHEDRRDITILRADKLLLKVAVERMRGVDQTDYSEAAITNMLRELGVDLVVFQPGFWEDLRQMARFASILHTPDFERVATFEIPGTVSHADKQIEIYRPTYRVARPRRELQLEMPIIRDRFSGRISSR